MVYTGITLAVTSSYIVSEIVTLFTKMSENLVKVYDIGKIDKRYRREGTEILLSFHVEVQTVECKLQARSKCDV